MSGKIDVKMRSFVLAESSKEDTEFIPLISDEEEDELKKTDIPEILPILPLKNTVLFPGVVIPITVGRDKSLALVKEIYNKDRVIGALAQKDAKIDDPEFEDLNAIGTLAQIVKILEMPDGSTSVIIQGKRRFRVESLISREPYFTARVSALEDVKPRERSREFDAIVGSLKDLALRIIKLSPNIPQEASFAIKNIESTTFLINFIGSNTDVNIREKQKC